MSEAERNLPLRLDSHYYLDLDAMHTLGTEPFLGWDEYQAEDLVILDKPAFRKWVRHQMPRSVAQKRRDARAIEETLEYVKAMPIATSSDLLDE